MKTLLTLAALAGLGRGTRHFLILVKEQKKNRTQATRLESWEGEGGAVPVAATRTAAQVRPRKPSAASPRGVR